MINPYEEKKFKDNNELIVHLVKTASSQINEYLDKEEIVDRIVNPTEDMFKIVPIMMVTTVLDFRLSKLEPNTDTREFALICESAFYAADLNVPNKIVEGKRQCLGIEKDNKLYLMFDVIVTTREYAKYLDENIYQNIYHQYNWKFKD